MINLLLNPPSELMVNLHSAIASLAPIHGVSVGEVNNKDTWTVWFKDDATDLQKNDVKSLIDNYVFEA